MNAGQHLAFGLLATGGGLWVLHSVAGLDMEATQVGLALAAAGIGSLAPDIDHPKSTISSGIPLTLMVGSIPLVGVVLIWASMSVAWGGHSLAEVYQQSTQLPWVKYLLGIAGISFALGSGLMLASMVISAIFGHRGATHSLAFLVVATLVAVGLCYLLGFPLIYGIIFGWGYLSHLLADSLTPMGLPDLLWPMA